MIVAESDKITILFPGWKMRPVIMPRHRGRPIRRNGISLCSTAGNFGDSIKIIKKGNTPDQNLKEFIMLEVQ